MININISDKILIIGIKIEFEIGKKIKLFLISGLIFNTILIRFIDMNMNIQIGTTKNKNKIFKYITSSRIWCMPYILIIEESIIEINTMKKEYTIYLFLNTLFSNDKINMRETVYVIINRNHQTCYYHFIIGSALINV
jgi:hypothetical protein